jgi:hypothetical protein
VPELNERKRIYLNALPEYEMKLLAALSFFLGRKISTQAAAALCMYLRQSHDRILTQVEYYAHRAEMNKWDFLDLIFENPEAAEKLMKGEEGIHRGIPDVFTED